jgi:hypothetical protein
MKRPAQTGVWAWAGISFLIAVLFGSAMVLSHETTTTTVLFDREIVRILDQHCVMCHRDRGLAFPLETYEQTWLRGRSVRDRVLARHMPPWAALPGYGQFANDNSLTLREVQFIVSWVEGLGPRNAGTVFLNVTDPGTRPPQQVRAQAHEGHWQLGQPSLTRPLPANRIDAGQADHIRRVVIDPELRSERRVRAIEYMPGDSRVVRAAFFTVEETGQWLGSWTPWYGYTLLPAGAAYRLPAGASIAAEIHYRGAKEPVVDQGTLGLFFAGGSNTRTVSDLVLDRRGEIPGGATAHRFRSEVRLNANIAALALRAEVFEGVQSIEVSARRPDGGTEVLLYAKDLPLDWPTPYVFKEPVRLTAGTVLAVRAYYANPSSRPQPGGIHLTVSRY